MPFEPRLFGQPDEDPSRAEREDGVSPAAGFAQLPDAPIWNDVDELELPDDLAQLAEQLRDDALYLAERHPADATPQQREAAWRDYVDGDAQRRSTSSHPWRWVSAAAALAIVISCLGYYVAKIADNSTPSIAVKEPPRFDRLSSDVLSNQKSISGDPLSVEGLAKEGNVDHVQNRATVTELPGEQPRLIPAAFIRDVTGPELDGMLDLLEQDESGLSI